MAVDRATDSKELSRGERLSTPVRRELKLVEPNAKKARSLTRISICGDMFKTTRRHKAVNPRSPSKRLAQHLKGIQDGEFQDPLSETYQTAGSVVVLAAFIVGGLLGYAIGQRNNG